MASWYIAPSLRALTDEVNDLMAPPTWPSVSVGDGALGDASHSNRTSDHNPAPSGVVRAVDIGISGRDTQRILKEVIGDPRVWYVIHNRTIWSRTYGFSARAYTGSNPHTSHIHISIRHTKTAENDTRPWFGNTSPAPTKPPEDDMPLSAEDKKWLTENLPWHVWRKEIGGGDNRRSASLHLLWSSNAARQVKDIVRNQANSIRQAVRQNATKEEIETMLNDLDATIQLIVDPDDVEEGE